MSTIVSITTTEARGGLGHGSAGLPPRVWSVKEEEEASRLTASGRRGRQALGHVGAARKVPRRAVTAGSLGENSEGSRAWKLQRPWVKLRRLWARCRTPPLPWGREGACSPTPGEPGGRWWPLPLLQ